jgi:transposase InsO family protein
MIGVGFLRNVIAVFPYKIRTVLTDNGVAFTNKPLSKYPVSTSHAFDLLCRRHRIEHRLTKPYHPWTSGQAERMNRTIKDATVKAFHYETLDELRHHVIAFVRAYNFAKH